MQLMPATGRQLHRREGHGGRPDLENPAVNVRLGVAYLRRLLDDFGGDTVLALAAYNAGPARARRWRSDLAALPADEFFESIPFSETRFYVKRVLFFEGAYASLYGVPASVPARTREHGRRRSLTPPASAPKCREGREGPLARGGVIDDGSGVVARRIRERSMARVPPRPRHPKAPARNAGRRFLRGRISVPAGRG